MSLERLWDELSLYILCPDMHPAEKLKLSQSSHADLWTLIGGREESKKAGGRGSSASLLIDPIRWILMLSHWRPNQSRSMLMSLPDSIWWTPVYKAPLYPSFQPRLPNPLLTIVSLVTAKRPYIHGNSRAEGVGWISNVSFISMLDIPWVFYW